MTFFTETIILYSVRVHEVSRYYNWSFVFRRFGLQKGFTIVMTTSRNNLPIWFKHWITLDNRTLSFIPPWFNL